jgi:8-oxo-dGTP diphosphatase
MNLDAQGAPSTPPVRVSVAVLFFDRIVIGATGRPRVPQDPKILIAQRPVGTHYAGYWEFPGGKVEVGESAEGAAVRECREELGVTMVPATVLPPIIHTYDHATVELSPVVGGLAEGSPEPRNLAVAAHRWCPISELPWAEFLPANIRIVTALRRAMDFGL